MHWPSLIFFYDAPQLWNICLVTSIFGLINEETKLKYKTAHFKHLTANFHKLMVYHLCWCYIRCLLDSVSKFVSLSISMKLTPLSPTLRRPSQSSLNLGICNNLSAWISDNYFESFLLPQQPLNRPAVNAIQWCHYPKRNFHVKNDFCFWFYFQMAGKSRCLFTLCKKTETSHS